MNTKTGRSPLLKQHDVLFINSRLLNEMSALCRNMSQLSPDTREKWKIFVTAAWKDIRFQKSQVEMYAAASEEGRSQVKSHNEAVRKLRKNIETKKFKTTNLYKCTRCYDKGFYDIVVTEGKEFKLWCTCELGVSEFANSPQGQLKNKQQELKKQCENQRSKIRVEILNLKKQIINLTWKESDDHKTVLCNHCMQGFNKYWDFGDPDSLWHPANCYRMPQVIADAFEQIKNLKQQYKDVYKKLMASLALLTPEKK